MTRVLRMVMMSLWLAGLAACAASSSPGFDQVAVGEAPWRHWQPKGPTIVSFGSGDRSEGSGSAGRTSAAAGPKAVVLALHGFNDYSNAFQDVAAYLKERDIAVHAYDQRGFGANPDRGLWPGLDRLTTDLEGAIARLRRVYGETPLYVLGESMGGAVAIAAATGETPLEIDGLILSAPAVWGGPHMNPFYRLTLWLASTMAPGWEVRPPEGLEIWPSDNIEMLRAFSADPLVIKGTRTDAVAGLVALMDRALAAAPKLDQDVLILMGEKDEIVPGGALEDFQSRLETTRATTISYPDGYHMLLRDLQRARVFADIVDWIDHRRERQNVLRRQQSSKL